MKFNISCCFKEYQEVLNYLLHSIESQKTRVPNIKAKVTLNLTSSSLILDTAPLNKASLNNYKNTLLTSDFHGKTM
jgi:hypothetical protein